MLSEAVGVPDEADHPRRVRVRIGGGYSRTSSGTGLAPLFAVNEMGCGFREGEQGASTSSYSRRSDFIWCWRELLRGVNNGVVRIISSRILIDEIGG